MDITTLGIAVDSKPVDEAGKKLDQFVEKAGKAEKAAKGIGEGAKEGAKGFDDMEGAMTRASTKGNLFAEAIEAGIQRAIQAVSALFNLLQQVGDYQDFSDMTGAAATNIAKLQTAADVAGVSMGTLTTQMNMMTRMLAASDEESDKAAAALGRIGINWQEFMKLDPAERLVALSAKMNEYGNNAEMSEVKQALFGRGAGEVGKVIVALGDGTAATTMLTQEMIEAQDDLNDSQAALASQMRQWIQFVMTGATPALSAFMGAIGDSVTAALGLGNASDALGANKGIEIFAIGAARLFGQVIEAGQVVYRTIEIIVSGVVSLAKAVDAVSRHDYSGAAKQFEGHATRVREIMSRELFSQSFERNLDKYYSQQVLKQAETEQKMLDTQIGAGNRRTAAKKGEVDRWLKEQERLRKAAEKEAAREKAAEEKERMKFGREESIRSGEAVIKANEEYQKMLAKFREEQQKSDDKAIESAQEQIKAINDRAFALEEEVRTRGMLRSQIEEEKLAIMERDLLEFEGSEIALAQLEKKIDAQKRLIDAIKGQESVQATEKQAKQMEDIFSKTWDKVGQSLTDSIMQGGISARDMLVRAFRATVLEPVVRAVVQGGMGMVGDAMGIQGMGGGAGQSLLSQMIGNRGLGSLFTDFSGGATNFASNAGARLYNMGMEKVGGALMENAGAIGNVTTALGYAGVAIGAYRDLKDKAWGSAIGAGVGAWFGGPIGGMVGKALGGFVDKLFGWGKKNKPPPVYTGEAGITTWNGQYERRFDAQMQEVLTKIEETYKGIAQALGGTANMRFGVGMSVQGDKANVYVDSSAGARHYTRGIKADDQKAIQDAISEGVAFVIVDSLKHSNIEAEVLGYFEKISSGLSGEAKLAAVEQAAAVLQVRNAIRQMSPVVAGLRNITMDATVAIAGFAGGLQNLAAGLAAYRQNFFSMQEQLKMGYDDMAKMMNAPGSGWTGASGDLLRGWDKNFFRKVVDGINLTTEAGQRQFATMMNMAGAFAQMEEAEKAEAERAKAEAEERAQQAAERARQWEEEKRIRMEYDTIVRNNTYSLANFNGRMHEMRFADLVNVMGGMEKMTAGFQGLMSNYSTTMERRQGVGRELAAAFAAEGSPWYRHLTNSSEVLKMAREDFIQIFRTIDLNSASGRKLAAEMLRLEGAFAGITQQIREPTYYTVDSALAKINDKYQEQVGIQKDLAQSLDSANKSFQAFMDSMKLDDKLSTLTPGEQMAEARRQYETAKLEMEKGNYSGESVARFTEVARSLLDQGRSMYASGSEYSALFEQVDRDMRTGQLFASRGLSEAERQIKALDDQVAQFKNANHTLSSIDEGIKLLYRVWRGEMVVESTPWGARGAGLQGIPSHAMGLERVPHDGYVARLHANERVQTAQEVGSLVGEVRALRQEVSKLRQENRQDAGNTIGATFEAARQAAQVQSEATTKAARTREYQTRNRPVLA